MKRIIVAISGASGANLGIKTLDALPSELEKHLIVSDNAKVVFEHEEKVILHNDENIAASIASGSFKCEAMIITPCSMNTLAKIAHGIADTLTTRAAAVMIKERRTLLLAPRELPFSPIALENMQKLSQIGVIIAPPVMAYYSEQNSLEKMENFVIGKWFDLLEIEHNLYKRWEDN